MTAGGGERPCPLSSERCVLVGSRVERPLFAIIANCGLRSDFTAENTEKYSAVVPAATRILASVGALNRRKKYCRNILYHS